MEHMMAVCTMCGKRFVYGKDDKYFPCCSKDCFYRRMGIIKKQNLRKSLVKSDHIEHDMFCRNCGKKVDFLHVGTYCSPNCKYIFNEQYDNHMMSAKKEKKKKSYFAYCVICGRTFGIKNKRNRFCPKCAQNKKLTDCVCFKRDNEKYLKVPKTRDMCDVIIESRERNMSYAELQKEETLRKLFGKG